MTSSIAMSADPSSTSIDGLDILNAWNMSLLLYISLPLKGCKFKGKYFFLALQNCVYLDTMDSKFNLYMAILEAKVGAEQDLANLGKN